MSTETNIVDSEQKNTAQEAFETIKKIIEDEGEILKCQVTIIRTNSMQTYIIHKGIHCAIKGDNIVFSKDDNELILKQSDYQTIFYRW